MAGFNQSVCVNAMHTLIGGVAGITGGAGQVHKRRRLVRSEDQVKALLAGTGGKVNAWMISPAAANTTVTERGSGFNAIGTPGGGRVIVTAQFQIEAYYQIDDAAGSEETFRDLTWLVADTFNSYGVLNIAGIIMQLPCDVEQFGFIALMNFGLYHYARLGIGFRGQTRP